MEMEMKTPEKEVKPKGCKLWKMFVAFLAGAFVASIVFLVPAMGGAGFIGYKVPRFTTETLVTEKMPKGQFGTAEGNIEEEVPPVDLKGFGPIGVAEGNIEEEVPPVDLKGFGPIGVAEGNIEEEVPPVDLKGFGPIGIAEGNIEEEVPPVDLKGFGPIGIAEGNIEEEVPPVDLNLIDSALLFDRDALMFDSQGSAYIFDDAGNAYVFSRVLNVSSLNLSSLQTGSFLELN